MKAEESVQLRKQLVDAIRGHQAHLEFDAAVKDFPADLRGVKPPERLTPLGSFWSTSASPSTIFWSSLGTRNTSRRSGRKDIGHPPMRLLAPLRGTRASPLFAAMAKLSTRSSRIRKTIFSSLCSRRRSDPTAEALLVASHNSYHLGQFVYLRKMLEAAAT